MRTWPTLLLSEKYAAGLQDHIPAIKALLEAEKQVW